MKELLKNIRMWPLWWTLPLIVLAVYYMPDVISWMDPTGAAVHPDMWQFVVLAVFIVILFNDFAFASIAANHPYIFKWYKKKFDEDSDDAPWLLFCYWGATMLFFVLVLMALV